MSGELGPSFPSRTTLRKVAILGGGNVLVVPVFNIRALVIPTVGFSIKNTTPQPQQAECTRRARI